MPKAGNAKKKHDSPKPDTTVKQTLVPSDVELTQKIEVDYKAIIDKDRQEALIASLKEDEGKKSTTNVTSSISVFHKKRITDEYVKSNSIINTIDSVPLLESETELQDVTNNYELKDKFSEGAQGIIRTAFDKSLKRDVVVKSLKGDKDEKYVRQAENLFVSEARIMAQLDHPSIVPLYGLHCGTENKLHLAMKHIHGKTLQRYLLDIIDLYKHEGVENFDEKRSIATRIEYLIKVCEAIDYAHCKGVIHRDIKSENIMIGNYGEVYVMDWGLASLVNPKKKKTGESAKRGLVGTPCYIAPELIMGGEWSRQSDIFALGMVFFEIITLQRAAGGKTVNEVLKNIINRNYCQFKHRFLKGRLSNDLKAIFEKAVHPTPSHRYKTVNEMAEDMKLYLMREETIARPDNIFRKFIRTMNNHKMMTLTVVLFILLAFAGITIKSLYSQNILVHKQKEREGMLARFQYDVSQKAAEINGLFGYFKYQLASLAYNAGSLMNKPPPPLAKPFDMKYYKDKSTAPLDYAYSPAYGRKISLYFTAFKHGAGDNNYSDRQIAVVWENLLQVFWKSDRALMGKTTEQCRKMVMKDGVVMSWVYVGLMNGSMIYYPGGNIKKNFDVRKLRWYKNALNKEQRFVWSKPYLNIFCPKLVISCSRSIHGRLVKCCGAAGMDISLDYISKKVFRNRAGLKEYLLTKEGRVVISSDFDNKRAKLDKNGLLILKQFQFQQEFKNAVQQKSVLFQALKDDTKYVLVYNELPSIGYYYVQRISEYDLYKAWENRQRK